MAHSKKFSITIFLLLVSLILSSCTKINDNVHFKFVGQSFIPEGLTLGDLVAKGNQIYFLEKNTDNIFIVSISKYKDKEKAFDFYLEGSYFPLTILRYPASICSDENNTLFVLETGDKVSNFPGLRIIPSSDFSFPIHIRAIYSNGEIKEISNLHLKLKELKQAKEAVKIRYYNDCLIIMFDNLKSLLFLKLESFEKNIPSYFILELPGQPIDFDVGEDSFVVLLNDYTLLKYGYNPINNNVIKDQIKIQNLTNNSQVVFSESNDLIILYDSVKEKIYIKDNKQDIIVSAKGVLKVFKLKIDDNEEIFVIKKEKGIKDYFIYRII